MDSTLIGSLIGAGATIAGALISRGIVVQRVKDPSRRMGYLTGLILRGFSLFSISEARMYKIRQNRTVVDDLTGLILTANRIGIRSVSLRMTIPGEETKVTDRLKVGDVMNLTLKNTSHQLIIAKVVEREYMFGARSFCLVEIRKGHTG